MSEDIIRIKYGGAIREFETKFWDPGPRWLLISQSLDGLEEERGRLQEAFKGKIDFVIQETNKTSFGVHKYCISMFKPTGDQKERSDL